VWDKNKKVTERQPFSTPFQATILVVRWQVAWKYKENSSLYVRSDEFDGFGSTQFRLHRFETKNGKTEHDILPATTYSDLKKKHGSVDTMTGETTYPFELHAVLYASVGGTIYRIDMKGSSRSNWFDFFEMYRIETSGLHLAQRDLLLEAQEQKMKTGETYYAIKFSIVGPATLPFPDAVQKIKELKQFFGEFLEMDGKEEMHEEPSIAPQIAETVQNTISALSVDPSASQVAKMDYLSQIAGCKTVDEALGIVELIKMDSSLTATKAQVLLSNIDKKIEMLSIESPF
jgi:hypothetical protein